MGKGLSVYHRDIESGLKDYPDNAFDYAYGVAKRDNGVLYIIHVMPFWEAFETIKEEFLEREHRESIKSIEEKMEVHLSGKFTEHYVNKMDGTISYELVTKSGAEADQIIKFAQDEGIDLIVIGTHGRTGFEHVFFGSVAEKILRHSPIPVFVIPCKERLGCS